LSKSEFGIEEVELLLKLRTAFALMAPSLRKFGRKASQLFSRDDARSSESSPRFQIVQSITEDESGEDSSETATSPQQQTSRPTAASSILQYVNSNFTHGSSLADMDSIVTGEPADDWQVRREEDNIAMRRIDSELSPMEQTSLAVSTPTHIGVSRPGHSSSAFPRSNQPLNQPGTSAYRHQPKPSVPEVVDAGFFMDASARPNLEGSTKIRANPNLTCLSSMASIPSSTDSFRERKLRGTLVRNSSMNWEVAKPHSASASQEHPLTRNQGIHQATVENAPPLDSRAWADFTDSEFDGDSRRQLVQVGPEEWRLVSASIQNLATQAIPEYRPLHPSQVIPEEFIPQGHILAGSLSQRNFNANPANNPMWQVQHAYPAIQNLNAAVQHASTDMHALVIENQVLRHEAAVNAYKIQSMDQELLRANERLRDANLDIEQDQMFSTGLARGNLEARMGEEGDYVHPRPGTPQSETSDLYGSATHTKEDVTVGRSSSRFNADGEDDEDNGEADDNDADGEPSEAA
jgi:hypothetical protein